MHRRLRRRAASARTRCAASSRRLRAQRAALERPTLWPAACAAKPPGTLLAYAPTLRASPAARRRAPCWRRTSSRLWRGAPPLARGQLPCTRGLASLPSRSTVARTLASCCTCSSRAWRQPFLQVVATAVGSRLGRARPSSSSTLTANSRWSGTSWLGLFNDSVCACCPLRARTSSAAWRSWSRPGCGLSLWDSGEAIHGQPTSACFRLRQMDGRRSCE
mmetsp:Transcript_73678/g.206842  ORF Transcript_73678/g.206842 Transcript_73678/m.206842 type:complete len:219 (+) Transcript_73678:173-829(+)